MIEYIDRQAATSIPLLPKEHRYYQTLNLDDAFDNGWNAAMECVGLIPAADVRENVRGEWKQGTAILNRSICSACGWWTDEVSTDTYNFCPNCGAAMSSQCGTDMREEKQ